MEIGGFKRIIVEEKDDQLTVNNKMITATNINFDRVFKALQNSLDFDNNVDCFLATISVQHGQTIDLNHALNRIPTYVLLSASMVQARVLSIGLKTLAIECKLPQAFLTKAPDGKRLYVSDPWAFESGDAIMLQRTGNYEPVEHVIESIDIKNRTLNLKTVPAASQFDIIYKKSETIKILVF